MRPSTVSRSALGAAVAITALVGYAGQAYTSPAQEAAARFEGEFGLYVRLLDEGLEVHWLTDDPVPGVARAFVDGALVDEQTTKSASEHMARLEADAKVVTIEFGVDEPGRLTRTEIYRTAPAPPDLQPSSADSIYIFGDVHGQYDRVVGLLEGSGLLDESGHWTGGKRTVAFLGDLFDRGDDVTALLWFLYRLEHEAARAGGQVLVLLGNHESMVMIGELGYVSGKEASLGFRHRVPYGDMFHPKESVLGRWLASKPGLIKLDDLLLAHGGVSPAYLGYTLQEFDDSLRAFMAESLFLEWADPAYVQGHLQEYMQRESLDTAAVLRRYGFFFDPESVFWYRDLVLSDTLAHHLDDVLDRFGAAIHIVGHTPVETIQARYDGRLIAVDLLEAASEMLLLVRDGTGGWTRSRIPIGGSPVPLATHYQTGRPQ